MKIALLIAVVVAAMIYGCAAPDTVVRESPNLSGYRDSIATKQHVTNKKN